MTELAIIGGTGLNRLSGLEVLQEHSPETPFGMPSAPVIEGRYAGARCLFLARHGTPHRIAPHRINYRANIWALKSLGATTVLGVNAVGGIRPELVPGRLVIPGQLVDYTWGRAHTFYDGERFDGDLGELDHIDFTAPYAPGLRQALADSAQAAGIECAAAGAYAVTQGPRLETAAEVRRLAQDGCDVVGMTGMPEAALAAECGLAYASLCVVVNPAAGLSDEPITLDSMREALEQGAEQVGRLLAELLVSERWRAPGSREQ